MYTGLRPGEKLYEELLIGDNIGATEHPMILRAYEERLPWTAVHRFLDRLLLAANKSDCGEIQQVLLADINGYKPACEQIEDLLWQSRAASGSTVEEGPEVHLVGSSVQRAVGANRLN